MVPAYANIAHYRAPYKNAVFAGFGDEGGSDDTMDKLKTYGPWVALGVGGLAALFVMLK